MKRKMPLLAIISVGLAAASVSLAQGMTGPIKFKAALNVGQEKPIPKGTKLGASGRFTATLKGTALTWRLTFRHLSGPATAAHIHMGRRKVAGPIVIPLCGPSCTSPVTGGPVTLTADQIKDLLAGRYYVNVHTTKNPAGEIRGQITKAITHA